MNKKATVVDTIATEDWDFIGFSYDGKHSVRDLKIYRTSDGSFYSENLGSNKKDKTISVEGLDGTYLFGSNVDTKVFNISFAFDELYEEDISNLVKLFDGKEVKELIFDEHPYKAYDAKVTGAPALSYICFDHPIKGRVYKGTGKVTFTCYYPFAHTPKQINQYGRDGRYFSYYVAKGYCTAEEWRKIANLLEDDETLVYGINRGEKASPFVANLQGSVKKGTTVKIAYATIIINEDAEDVIWDSKTGMVSGKVQDNNGNTIRRAINYTGNSLAELPILFNAPTTSNYISVSDDKVSLSIDYQFWYY